MNAEKLLNKILGTFISKYELNDIKRTVTIYLSNPINLLKQ